MMKKTYIKINDIPAIVWGEDSSKVFIAIHGNHSNKEDIVIEMLAKCVCDKGYQVISFDLPKHGDRVNEATLCKVQNCVVELSNIYDFISKRYDEISLWACSLGAYFSLVSYRDVRFKQCLFLSPVVDMLRVIENMMSWFNVDADLLEKQETIETPIGETLYYDYYCYVKKRPIDDWNNQTDILYGDKDELCEYEYIKRFSDKFSCDLTILENGEHFFHLPEQLTFYQAWLKKKIK